MLRTILGEGTQTKSQLVLLTLISALTVSPLFAATDISFRYRLETVETDGVDENALASTLRSRFNYQTAPRLNTSLTLEIDNVSYLGGEQFNSTRNGNTRFPTVADPDGTHINQFFVTHEAEKFTTRIGRQRLLHDNQRFVGGVGWRQNEQTYDAFDLAVKLNDALDLSWQYVEGVSRIFGPKSGTPDASFNSNSHFIRATLASSENTRWIAFGYLLDFDNATAASTKTYGLNLSHQLRLVDQTLPFSVVYARQSDHGDNSRSLSVYYLAADTAMAVGGVQARIGFERLSGSSTGGFETPLATLHKFQGWSDQFLSTPPDGVDDVFASLNGSHRGSSWAITYHRFRAEKNSRDYGDELNVSISRPFNQHVKGLFKVAQYRADTFKKDTLKLWFTLMVTI